MDTGKSRRSASSSTLALRNPAAGHSGAIDSRTKQWGNVDGDIFNYLSDVKRLEQFADQAHNAEELASRLQPFLNNAEKYLESMAELAKGQATWTELRAKFGKNVGDAILKIRKLDAKFSADMELLDAKDRAAMTTINQKRQHGLREIAAQLNADLQMELFRHQSKIGNIADREQISAQRAQITEGLRAKRQQLTKRISYGSRGLNSAPPDRIPVAVGGNGHGPSQSVSASGSNRGNFGGLFSRLWNGLGN
ncbi:MAG: hypothetical protein WBF53_16175 [Litorimonas sp.]